MNCCHFEISGNYSNFAVCESILCLSGYGIELGHQEDVEGACSLSKTHFCPDLKPYIQRVSLMPYFLVGFNMHKACAGSLQLIKLSSSEIRCIFPPVNVVSLEQTQPTIILPSVLLFASA